MCSSESEFFITIYDHKRNPFCVQLSIVQIDKCISILEEFKARIILSNFIFKKKEQTTIAQSFNLLL